MNKSTGKEEVGRDVAREHQRAGMADALRPLTGMDAKELDRSGRRMKLTTEAQKECRQLDREIPSVEQQEKSAKQGEAALIQQRLLQLRAKFRALRCE